MNFGNQGIAPQPMKSIADRIKDIIEFINNPNEKSTEKVIDNIIALCSIQTKIPIPQIAYKSSKFCALSGVELKDDSIAIQEFYFSPERVQEYYLRDGILDVSIGDLEFKYYDGQKEEHKCIELSWEMLETVFGDNLTPYLRAAETHFNKRFQEPAIY